MPYPDNVLRLSLDEHRFVFISGRTDQQTGRPQQYDVQPVVSFVYVDGDWAAEWETKYGPIALYRRAEIPEDAEPVPKKDAKEGDPICHYIWPCVNYSPLDWSQRAVEDYNLAGAFVDGRWDQIFGALQNFVKSRIEHEELETA